jgi:hypothetical protein
MRRPIAMLFENKVFSLAPNTFSSSSFLEELSIQKEGQNYFIHHSSIEPFCEKLIYQYDPVESFLRDQRLQNRRALKIDVDFAKKFILDDNFPAWLSFSIGEEEFSDDYGDVCFSSPSFCLEGGRSSLIKLLRDNRCSGAIPELREVAMYDTSKPFRRLAVQALWSLDRQKADNAINDVFLATNDRFAIMDIAKSIALHSTGEIFVSTLRKKFEEHYFDYVDNYLSIKWYGTVPQSIILACGHISTIGALEILEQGIKHPYCHVENNSKYGLVIWLENFGSSTKTDSALLKKALDLEKKYDLKNYSGDSWKKFKKPSSINFLKK